jgi:hypothetical protein
LYAPLGFLNRVCSSHARRRHADAVVIVALLMQLCWCSCDRGAADAVVLMQLWSWRCWRHADAVVIVALLKDAHAAKAAVVEA